MAIITTQWPPRRPSVLDVDLLFTLGHHYARAPTHARPHANAKSTPRRSPPPPPDRFSVTSMARERYESNRESIRAEDREQRVVHDTRGAQKPATVHVRIITIERSRSISERNQSPRSLSKAKPRRNGRG